MIVSPQLWICFPSTLIVTTDERLYDVDDEKDCMAKFRYRQKDNPVHLKKLSDSKVLVSYPQKVAAVTCGQEAVFYDGDICLGGGVIEQVFVNGKDMNDVIEDTLKGTKHE